jgi:hypothetical protein
MLAAEMKAPRLDICQQLLSCFQSEGEAFLHNVIKAYEMLVHHYEPETKHQSVEHRHKGSPSTKIFKTHTLAGKLMAAVFWDANGVIHMDFLEPGTMIHSEPYIATLRTL